MSQPAPPDERPGWLALPVAALLGGLLIALPHVPLAWALRLWVLGWMLEVQARIASTGVLARYPSWRSPWACFKRGLSYWCEVFPLLLHAGAFVLLPMASVQAARTPGKRAAWDLADAYELALARPLRYCLVLALSGFLGVVLQVLRSPRLQHTGEFLLAGMVSFLILLGVKRLWAGHWFLASRLPTEARWTSRPLRVAFLLAFGLIGLVHAFGLLAAQFLMFAGGSEWFAHALFLIPGAPAPLARDGLYW